jgi:hypothetical protein
MMKKRYKTGMCCWQYLNTDVCKTERILPAGRNNFAPFFVEMSDCSFDVFITEN